ncbi:MAG TPA: hypothetical protein V6D22_08640 [Candidatus Obscuribacterales bacterium]
MYKLLEGQISFAGMQYALESVCRLNGVKNGILRITSNEGSGLIGIFCGRFITGAAMTLSGDTGHRALRQLLAVSDGSYAFLDAGDEVFDDLKQNLGVDVEQLLAAGLKVPLTDETLTGMQVSGDEIRTVDTTRDLSLDAEEDHRVERIQVTYDKLLSLSRRPTPTATTAVEPELPASIDPQSANYESPDAGTLRPDEFENVPNRVSEPRELPREVTHERTPLPSWDQPWEAPREKKPDMAPTEFRRIKSWSQTGRIYKAVTLTTFAIVSGGILYFLWPTILGLFHIKVH